MRRWTGDAAANALRARFNALQTEATRLAAASDCPDVLGEVRMALADVLNLANAQGATPAATAFAALEQQLDDSRVRLQELCDFALDETGARQLGTMLGKGASPSLHPVVDNAVLMGWGIEISPLY
ncbi:hypothetical protein [Massilia sp. Se16.2.3]|uniref:hypothetical protein n=1 Tax=Massilia sp. Se16.2.3 TaxID=2709303 RepID=UPI001E314B3F|nr:hypothetical protein [Massilia sp. Se16.2.3]